MSGGKRSLVERGLESFSGWSSEKIYQVSCRATLKFIDIGRVANDTLLSYKVSRFSGDPILLLDEIERHQEERNDLKMGINVVSLGTVVIGVMGANIT